MNAVDARRSRGKGVDGGGESGVYWQRAFTPATRRHVALSKPTACLAVFWRRADNWVMDTEQPIERTYWDVSRCRGQANAKASTPVKTPNRTIGKAPCHEVLHLRSVKKGNVKQQADGPARISYVHEFLNLLCELCKYLKKSFELKRDISTWIMTRFSSAAEGAGLQ